MVAQAGTSALLVDAGGDDRDDWPSCGATGQVVLASTTGYSGVL